jgi:hypothetical protein
MPPFRVWLESPAMSSAPVVPSSAISVVVHAALVGGLVTAAGSHSAAAPQEEPRSERVAFLLPFDQIPRERYQPVPLDWKAIGVDVGVAIGDPQPAGGPVEHDPAPRRGKRGRAAQDAKVLEPSFRENEFEGNVFTILEVDSSVARFPDSAAPSYPPDLLAMGVEGVVKTRYVVDTTGMADTASLKILFSTHPRFTEAVRAAFPYMRFRPASLGGRHVRQLVEQEFHFKITPPATRVSSAMKSHRTKGHRA